MTEITDPKSTFIDNEQVYVSWTCNVANQSSYEFIYKKKHDTSWKSLGVVASSAKNMTVPINTFEYMQEYYYRIVLKVREGTEYSPAYSIVVHPKQLGSMKVKIDVSQVDEIPLYQTKETPVGVAVVCPFNNDSRTLHANIVDADSDLPVVKSGLKIQTASGPMSFLKHESDFQPTGIVAGGAFAANYTYNYQKHDQYRTESYTYYASTTTYYTTAYYYKQQTGVKYVTGPHQYLNFPPYYYKATYTYYSLESYQTKHSYNNYATGYKEVYDRSYYTFSTCNYSYKYGNTDR